jgi:hypothetical protein
LELHSGEIDLRDGKIESRACNFELRGGEVNLHACKLKLHTRAVYTRACEFNAREGIPDFGQKLTCHPET